MLYAPIAAHESIQVLCFTASRNLHLDGCDILKVYLYREVEIPISMCQPANLQIDNLE